MNSKKRQSQNKGFSLVEVFLVTAILGVVLVTLGSAYAAGVKIWRTANQLELVKDRKFIISMEKMTEELSGYIRDFEDEDIDFGGDEGKVSFPLFSGSHAVQITYIFDKNRKYLLKKVVKLSDSLKDRMQGNKTELFDAKSSKFQYLLYDQINNTAYWASSFSKEDTGVPTAVKMEFDRKGENAKEYIFIPQ